MAIVQLIVKQYEVTKMRHGPAQYLFYVFQIITFYVDHRHANNLRKSLQRVWIKKSPN